MSQGLRFFFFKYNGRLLPSCIDPIPVFKRGGESLRQERGFATSRYTMDNEGLEGMDYTM